MRGKSGLKVSRNVSHFTLLLLQSINRALKPVLHRHIPIVPKKCSLLFGESSMGHVILKNLTLKFSN